MKKIVFTILLSIMSAYSFAQNSQIILGDLVHCQVRYDHPVVGGNPFPKSPILVSTVSIDGHTLYIYDVAYDMTLVLVDEDDEVVYSVFVPANTSTVYLPTTLTGDFQLLLIPDEDYYFAGEISL